MRHDEARLKAIAVGRARADLYARALGMRVVACCSGRAKVAAMRRRRCRWPYARGMVAQDAAAKTEIDPGTQQLQVSWR
jgi:uncharacterized protein YggE